MADDFTVTDWVVIGLDAELGRGIAMKKVLVCSNNGRAIAQVLMAAINESGIEILGQPLEFKNNDKDMGGFIVDNFDIF